MLLVSGDAEPVFGFHLLLPVRHDGCGHGSLAVQRFSHSQSQVERRRIARLRRFGNQFCREKINTQIINKTKAMREKHPDDNSF